MVIDRSPLLLMAILLHVVLRSATNTNGLDSIFNLTRSNKTFSQDSGMTEYKNAEKARKALLPVLPTQRKKSLLLDFAAKSNGTNIANSSSLSQAENFTALLMNVAAYTEENNYLKSAGDVLMFGEFKIEIVSRPEMRDTVALQSLCDQTDMLRRISCVGRCGRAPESRLTPGQCGCDANCFLYGDCCEDLNTVCPDDFIEAVRTFDFARDLIPTFSCPYDNVFTLFVTNRLASRVGNNTVQIHCDLQAFKQRMYQNIASALFESRCVMRSENLRATMRACDIPDLIFCISAENFNSYALYPASLLCFDHHYTKISFDQFVLGMTGTFLVSRIGMCAHIRVAKHLNLLTQANSTEDEWIPNPDILNMKIMPNKAGMKMLDFQSDTLGNIECKGKKLDGNMTCKMYHCRGKTIIDEISQVCCHPTRVFVHFSKSLSIGDRQKRSLLNETIFDRSLIGDDIFENLTSRDSSTTLQKHLNLCLCLKAHVVIKALGRWAVFLDTTSFVEGQCILNFLEHRTGGEENEEEVKEADLELWKSIEITTPVTEDELESNYEDYELANEYLDSLNNLSLQMFQLWRNDTRRCPKGNKFVMWCFYKNAAPSSRQSCVFWEKRSHKSIRGNGMQNNSLVNAFNSKNPYQALLAMPVLCVVLHGTLALQFCL